MFNGDQARKKTLIDYGFRLESALDNRPLRFDEFYSRIPQCTYVSATPNDWEIEDADQHIVQQLVRPTGIVDPQIDIRPTEGDIPDLVQEIKKRAEKGERTLVTTLTKRTAEDLTDFLKEAGVQAVYLHSDIKTLERTDILQKLRKHEYDVLVGVNLLREGLDLPEVTLVAILDGDKEGFLRSRTSLIQTMGRAARNISGEVIIYADTITKSMKSAIEEVDRRREYQIEYNTKHNITPRTIVKKIQDDISQLGHDDPANQNKQVMDEIDSLNLMSLTPQDKNKTVKKLEREMKKFADDMDFESAILLRDTIQTIKQSH
jgi:excinuclease ABC subunit B